MDTDRLCLHCHRSLPVDSRPSKLYCGVTCRMGAYDRRKREARIKALDGTPSPVVAADDPAKVLERLRLAVDEAIAVPRLLAVIAAEARGNWRAAAWLLTNVHGLSPQSVRAGDQGPPVDELAALRELHARMGAGR